jgi:hypothetical protein
MGIEFQLPEKLFMQQVEGIGTFGFLDIHQGWKRSFQLQIISG